VLNYFNYFTGDRRVLQKRRGALLLPLDPRLGANRNWREAGIPLEAALRGIDAAFDKYEARQKRGRMRRINGLGLVRAGGDGGSRGAARGRRRNGSNYNRR